MLCRSRTIRSEPTKVRIKTSRHPPKICAIVMMLTWVKLNWNSAVFVVFLLFGDRSNLMGIETESRSPIP